jgi:hypothetical protein
MASGSVVGLSVLLLAGYIGGMNRAQRAAELGAQAALCLASAEDMIRLRLSDRMRSASDLDGFMFEAGGLSTTIELIGSAPVPPVEISLGEAPEGSRWVPAAPEPVPVSFEEGVRALATAGAGAPATVELHSGVPARFVFDGPAGTSTVRFDAPITDGSLLEAGSIGGSPALAVYDARGPVAVLQPGREPLAGSAAPAAALAMTSCGAPSGVGDASVQDVVRGDMDSDGLPDLAVISSDRVTVFLTASPTTVADSVGGAAPVAWGLSGISGGLVVCWDGPGRSWRRLGWGGFQPLLPVGALSSHPWSGRLSEACNAIAGECGGALAVASCSSGELMVLARGEVTTIDLDGGSPDFMVVDGPSCTVVLDPLDGEGTLYTWLLSTAAGGGPTYADTLRTAVFVDAWGNTRLTGGGRT